jgi:hypothetical protein
LYRLLRTCSFLPVTYIRTIRANDEVLIASFAQSLSPTFLFCHFVPCSTMRAINIHLPEPFFIHAYSCQDSPRKGAERKRGVPYILTSFKRHRQTPKLKHDKKTRHAD